MSGPSKILGGDVLLYLGSAKDAKQKALLVNLNIKYILNCTPRRSDDPENGCPNFFEKERSFKYKRIPVFDNRGEDLLLYMDEAYQFIEEAKHYGGILVHCHKGVSRSATFVIGYIMRKMEMTYEEALEYVRSIRPVVAPNEAFTAQLKSYEDILRSNREKETSSSNSSLDIGPSVGPCMAPSIGPSVGPSAGPEVGPIIGTDVIGPDIGPNVTQEEASESDECHIGPLIGPSIGPAIGIGPVIVPVSVVIGGPEIEISLSSSGGEDKAGSDMVDNSATVSGTAENNSIGSGGKNDKCNVNGDEDSPQQTAKRIRVT